jgi:hypothetical protein
MINRTQMIDDGKAMGLKVETSTNGRVRLEGRDGDVRKVFVAQGLDIRRDSEHGFSFWDQSGECQGNLCIDGKGYAYGFTYEAGR